MGYVNVVAEKAFKWDDKNKAQECGIPDYSRDNLGAYRDSLMEAVALYYADDADAKLEIMVEEFSKTASTEFLGVNRFLGTNIRKTSRE